MGFVAKEIQEKRKNNINFLKLWARFAGKKMKNMINGEEHMFQILHVLPKKRETKLI